MTLSAYIMFDGNCKEALAYYEQVFDTSATNVMTYGDAPEQPGPPVPEENKQRILYSNLPIGDVNLMLGDMPHDVQSAMGNAITLVLGSSDADELKRVFTGLADGGEVMMPLEKTFFSPLFGMAQDRYGVIWQLSLDV